MNISLDRSIRFRQDVTFMKHILLFCTGFLLIIWSFDSFGGAPLFEAVKSGDSHLANELLQSGENANAKDRNGSTPLHIAILQENLNITRLLLDKGANPNATNIDGSTSLHIAASLGNEKLCELLIESGANVNVKNSDNENPIEVASKNGYNILASMMANASLMPFMEQKKIMIEQRRNWEERRRQAKQERYTRWKDNQKRKKQQEEESRREEQIRQDQADLSYRKDRERINRQYQSCISTLVMLLDETMAYNLQSSGRYNSVNTHLRSNLPKSLDDCKAQLQVTQDSWNWMQRERSKGK